MTPKGLEYKLQTLLKERRKFETKVSKIFQTLEYCVAEAEDYSIVIQMLEELEEYGDRVISTHQALCDLLETSNHSFDRDTERQYIEEIKGSIRETCESAKQYIVIQPTYELPKKEEKTFQHHSFVQTRSRLFTPTSDNDSDLESSPTTYHKHHLQESKIMGFETDYQEYPKNAVSSVHREAESHFDIQKKKPKYSSVFSNDNLMYKSQRPLMSEPPCRWIPELPLFTGNKPITTPPQQRKFQPENLDGNRPFSFSRK